MFIPKVPEQPQTLFEESHRLRVVALHPGQEAGAVKRARAREAGCGRALQDPRQPHLSFADITANEPELPEHAAQSQADFDLPTFRATPLQRRPKIIMLLFQTI